jgi:hypothetical protein
MEQFFGGCTRLVGGAMIDGTAALAIKDMIHMAETQHQQLVLAGMQPAVTEVLEGVGSVAIGAT